MLYLAAASVATQQADRARARAVAMMPSFSAVRSVAMVTAEVVSAWATIAMQ